MQFRSRSISRVRPTSISTSILSQLCHCDSEKVVSKMLVFIVVYRLDQNIYAYFIVIHASVCLCRALTVSDNQSSWERVHQSIQLIYGGRLKACSLKAKYFISEKLTLITE